MMNPILSLPRWHADLEILEKNEIPQNYLLEAVKKVLPRARAKQIKTLKDLNQKDIKKIIPFIRYALSLIGENSNQRFGSSSDQQNDFFLRPREAETIFTHLYLAINSKKQHEIMKDSNGAVAVDGNASMNDIHLAVRNLSYSKAFFKLAGKDVSEAKIYHAVVIYAYFLVCKFIGTEWAQIIENILIKIKKYSKGMNYASVDGRRGAQKTATKRKKPFYVALEIYIKEDLQAIGKNLGIALELKERLKKMNINRESKTLERWVSEFKKILKG